MSDINHGHATAGTPPPVEGDGINYGGIVWFVVILTVTTLFCQALVWGMFKLMDHRTTASDTARAPLAAPAGQLPPGPHLLTDEPGNLHSFRQKEDAIITSYTMDKATGAITMPVARAKALLLERGGLPVRPGTGTATPDLKPATAPTPAVVSPQKGGH